MDISPPLPTAPALFTPLNAPLLNPLLPFPSKLINSVALMVILPAFPSPLVKVESIAPLVTSRESVVMSTFPPLPTARKFTRLVTVLSPSSSIESVALIVTLPAFPTPLVLAEICASFVALKKRVVMDTSPPLPIAPGSTWLAAALLPPSLPSPSKLIKSVALIVTLPPFPSPLVLALTKAPLVTSREPVVIDISPALPFPRTKTVLNAPLLNPSLSSPSNLTEDVALIVTLPPFPSPAISEASAAPFVTSRETSVN